MVTTTPPHTYGMTDMHETTCQLYILQHKQKTSLECDGCDGLQGMQLVKVKAILVTRDAWMGQTVG